MKKWILVAVIVVLGAGVITGAFFLYPKLADEYERGDGIQEAAGDSRDDNTEAGDIKDFTVYDSAGNAVISSSLKGKPVVLYFWASWCPKCKAGIPGLQALYEKYGNDVEFMAVAVTGGGNDTKSAVDSVISEGGYTFPVFYDNDVSASIAYSVRSIPSIVFLNENGAVFSQKIGVPSQTSFENTIDSLISQPSA